MNAALCWVRIKTGIEETAKTARFEARWCALWLAPYGMLGEARA